MKEITEAEQVRRAVAQGQTVTAVVYDPDIIGAIIGQAELLSRGIPQIDPIKMQGIYDATGGIAIKLSALRYHTQRFNEQQTKRLAELKLELGSSTTLKGGIVICEKEMLFEFEAFFFQLKSALDMLVKIFVPLFGAKAVSLSSYGANGKDVVTYLEQLKKNAQLAVPVGRIDWLIELIQQVRDPWLKPLIALRDTISHYRSFIGIGFTWDSKTEQIAVPMAEVSGSTYPLVDVMTNETERLIDFSREFISRAILCAIPLHIGFYPMGEMENRYFSALWGKDLTRAFYNLSNNLLRNFTEQDIDEARERDKQRRQHDK